MEGIKGPVELRTAVRVCIEMAFTIKTHVPTVSFDAGISHTHQSASLLVTATYNVGSFHFHVLKLDYSINNTSASNHVTHRPKDQVMKSSMIL